MVCVRIICLISICMSLLACNHSGGTNHLPAGVKSSLRLEQLYQRHEQWQGTPYQLGGLSQQGIDCSGFVQLTFIDEFGLQLPRTTTAQSRQGYPIPEQQLRAGDLVFFNIPAQGKLQHVGIYLEQNKFLHASTSQGVIISDLTTTYWQDNYWKSIRVLP